MAQPSSERRVVLLGDPVCPTKQMVADELMPLLPGWDVSLAPGMSPPREAAHYVVLRGRGAQDLSIDGVSSTVTPESESCGVRAKDLSIVVALTLQPPELKFPASRVQNATHPRPVSSLEHDQESAVPINLALGLWGGAAFSAYPSRPPRAIAGLGAHLDFGPLLISLRTALSNRAKWASAEEDAPEAGARVLSNWYALGLGAKLPIHGPFGLAATVGPAMELLFIRPVGVGDANDTFAWQLGVSSEVSPIMELSDHLHVSLPLGAFYFPHRALLTVENSSTKEERTLARAAGIQPYLGLYLTGEFGL